MKKRHLLLSLCLFAGSYAFAVDSPYKGSPVGEGTFYLYQVETGKWLQANRKDISLWTTHAELDDVGFDVQLKKLDGFEGYQIYCNFTGNGELNGSDEDRFYLDQSNRDLTDWIFVPIEGAENQYKIMVKAKPDANDRSKIAQDTYIGAANGELSDNPTDFTWQLVTREERIEKMKAEAATGKPADATFLIPWNDRGRNDKRDRLWQQNFTNSYGGSDALGGSNGYPVKEDWHRMIVHNSIMLTDMPNGTYNFTVQAYYRDTEIESKELRDRYLNGTEHLCASYFAGSAKGTVMSIFTDAKDAQQDGYSYKVALTDDGGDDAPGKWVPNSMSDACTAMINGAYINKWIQAPVTDGKLMIGIEKTENDDARYRDWLIYKRFYLQYVSETPISEDLSGLRTELQDLITTGKTLTQTTAFADALASAQQSLDNATSSSSLLEAISTLQNFVDVMKGAKTDIDNFYATKTLAVAEGVDVSKAEEQLNAATTRDAISNALKQLRYVRRRNAAETCEDIFPGKPVTTGDFYIYNVGQKQFLCGGSDWGAHAALGFPGVEVTLEATETEAAENKFHIDSHLKNGDSKHYLSYRGYLDGSKAGPWKFVPVEGKENVYNIVQGDYPDVYVAWNPNASVDGGHGDETTVGTECRNLDPNDLNAQWKLVTRAEREALLKDASTDNPVDATFYIKSPGFNQRENASTVWSFSNASIWGYGGNHSDFIAESWNTSDCDISQSISNLPQGVYVVSVQGFYRNGAHEDQPNLELSQNADLYAGTNLDDTVLLPNITAESGKAPGEGQDAMKADSTITYHYPYSAEQAAAFFHYGLYRTHITVLKDYDDDFPIGVEKKVQGAEKDWVVVDNFRLTYYGNNTTVDAVEKVLTTGIDDVKADPARVADGKIYNLQGIQVTNTSKPGLYIKNGKKFVVK